MATKQCRFFILAVVFVFGLLFIAIPNNTQAEEGCCQYSNGDDLIGCQDVASAETCDEDSTSPNKKYFPNSECGKTGLCTGSKEENPEEKGFGCCQMFFGEDPGCMYPSSVGSCTGENRTFVETNECGEDGYCAGYKKE